jgi:hypothetical protein
MAINDFYSTILGDMLMQVPTGTNQFFEWYFYGLGGIGGWLIFLILALAATIWLFYDSQNRNLSATGWRLGAIVMVVLILPTVIYRFTVTPIHFGIHQILDIYEEDCPIDVIVQTYPEVNIFDCDALSRSLPPMTPYGEYAFYLGLLGGILAPVLAVGYYITYQGMVGCPNGHEYEAVLGECPHCAEQRRAAQPVSVVPPPVPVQPVRPQPPPAPVRPKKRAVGYAWLMDLTNNRRNDLYEDTTTIGRSSDNDIYLTDQAVSRNHAQIRESHGHFTLSDVGSRTGTLLNGRKIRASQVLQNNDEITLGDTVLRFVSSQ